MINKIELLSNSEMTELAALLATSTASSSHSAKHVLASCAASY